MKAYIFSLTKIKSSRRLRKIIALCSENRMKINNMQCIGILCILRNLKQMAIRITSRIPSYFKLIKRRMAFVLLAIYD
jgi:hypothetical protein